MKFLLPLLFTTSQIASTTINYNTNKNIRIESEKNSFEFVEKLDHKKTVLFDDNARVDENTYKYSREWLRNRTLLKDFFLKHFTFKISDKFINYLNDGLNMKISFDVDIERHYIYQYKDKKIQKQTKKVVCNFLDEFSFGCENQKEYEGIVRMNFFKDPKDLRNIRLAFYDFNTQWKCGYDKNLKFLNIYEAMDFEVYKNWEWNHSNFPVPPFSQLKYSVKKVKYEFLIPKTVLNSIKTIPYQIKDYKNIDQLENTVVDLENEFKKQLQKANKNYLDKINNIFSSWKLTDFSKREFGKFKWNDKSEIIIEIPISKKYEKDIKSLYLKLPIIQRIDVNSLIEINELNIKKEDIKNIKNFIPGLSFWLNTALDYKIEKDQLILTVKDNFKTKFYGEKKIKLNINETKPINYSNQNQNTKNPQINNYKKPRSKNLYSQHKVLITNPYLYMTISLVLALVLCSLYFLKDKKETIKD